MKKVFVVLLLVVIAFSSLNVYAENNPKDLQSKNVLLADASTGKLLYSEGIDTKIQPGGFTKIMTAIIAIENMLDSEETVVADGEILSQYDYNFGHMGILPGEILTLENLINGMLIYDAGDAAELIASYSADSRSDFIKKMNSKAVEIGALNTKFTNPTGFPDKKQYTTVEDIYKITRYAMKLEYFRDVVKKPRYEMKPTNKYRQNRYLDNKNKFLSATSTDKYYTVRAKGVKTSYIDDKKCGVILFYETDKISMISIVANSKVKDEINHSYEDTKKLINFGLEFYESVKVISAGDFLAEVELTNGKGHDRILLEANEDVHVNLPKDYDEDKLETRVILENKIKAPIKKGKILGSATVYYDGEEYISSSLTSPIEVKANYIKGFFSAIWKVISAPALLIVLGILLIIAVWAILLFNNKKKKTYKFDKRR